MSIVGYYGMMAKTSTFSSEYLAYKSRVESDGGDIVDEGATSAKFDFLLAQSLYSNISVAYDVNAGVKLNTSLVEKAYEIGGDSEMDISQSDAAKRPTASFDFDGVNDFLFTANNMTNIIDGDMTIVFKTGVIGSVAGIKRIYSCGVNSSNWRTNIYISEGVFVFLARTSAGTSQSISFSTSIASNKTYQFSVDDASDEVYLYVDGVLTETKAITITPRIDGRMYLSSFFGGSAYFDGIIENIYIMSGDRSALAVDIFNNL